jgi:hypothetical protein
MTRYGQGRADGGAPVTTHRHTAARLTLTAVALLSGALIVAPTALTAAAYIQRSAALPLLVRLDSALGRHFLVASAARLAPTAEGGLRVQPDRGHWPGLSLEEVWPDWRAYAALVIDLSNPGDQAVSIFVRVDDPRSESLYTERYTQGFELAPQSRRLIRIPVAAIESAPAHAKMDLAHIQRIMLFEDGGKPTYTFVLNSLRLEP